MPIVTRFAARSDVGLLRSSNQDSGYAGEHLLVLADGMGGPAGGDIASSVAVAHLAPLDDEHGADELLGLLRGAVADAHADLVARSTADPDLAGLGTTCIAMLRTGTKLAMVHIGDSRAYLLRDGELTQITTDHTFVQYLVSTGRLTLEEAERHPQRNMILRALGDTDGEVDLDESMREARPGDRWLLCSDGLFGVVSKDTIAETLRDTEDPGAAAQALVDLSLRAGAPDNVTCVVSDFLATADAPHLPSADPQVVGSAAERPTQRPGTGTTNGTGTGTTAATGAGASSAERAAALLGPDGDEPDTPRRRRLPRVLLSVVAGLVLLGAGAFAGWTWTQQQYFVAPSGDHVAIYRGIPQHIGPLGFSDLHERTDLRVDDLTPLAQQRLDSPITRGSLAGARDVVENLRESVVPEEPPEESPSESPSESSSESPSESGSESGTGTT
ncbi:PP2C family protein-serine/threonine phosphatase [Georgenia sp. Z1344]|uniref:PP2C family protein-serine/threonine phosphatase n=1 Tax=Georgenia sp. Z1344 TaxID=3416706 RepID=UPI003CF99684